MVKGTVFLATKETFSIEVIPLVLRLVRPKHPPDINAVMVSFRGGATFVVTIVVTGVQTPAVNSFMVKAQVVPPMGLFTLTVTTLFKTSFSNIVPALSRFLRQAARFLTMNCIGVLKIQISSSFIISAVSSGTISMGPSFLKPVGRPIPLCINPVIQLVKKLERTLLRKFTFRPVVSTLFMRLGVKLG